MGSPILEAVLVRVGATTLVAPEPERGPLKAPCGGGWYVRSTYPKQPPLFDAFGWAMGASRQVTSPPTMQVMRREACHIAWSEDELASPRIVSDADSLAM